MTTSQPTNKHTRVTPETEADLAAYGIVRKEALKNAAPSDDKSVFFGIKENGDSTELKFNASVETLQDDNMTVAMVAPENKTFNMLVSTNFNEAVKTATPDTLRTFLRDVLRKA